MEATGSHVGFAFLPPVEDDPRLRRPNIALARRELGWEPHVPRAVSLERTIACFRAPS